MRLFAVFHYSTIVSSCGSSRPLPKRVLHTEWDLVLLLFFKFQYLFLSRSSNSVLRLPIRLIIAPIFTSILCRRTQFLTHMWPIQLAFLRFFFFCTLNYVSISSHLLRYIIPYHSFIRHYIVCVTNCKSKYKESCPCGSRGTVPVILNICTSLR